MSRTNQPARIGLLTTIGGFALILAACSSGGASTAPSAAAPSVAAPSAAASGGGTGAVVIGTATGAPGSFLTGADGKTLYIFTADSPNTSTCVDGCAQAWPPVIVTGAAPAAPAGVSGALTTIARPDGSMQLAIGGWPLYYYAQDTKAGDVTGQGVGGKWFVAPLDGILASPVPSAALRD